LVPLAGLCRHLLRPAQNEFLQQFVHHHHPNKHLHLHHPSLHKRHMYYIDNSEQAQRAQRAAQILQEAFQYSLKPGSLLVDLQSYSISYE